jgi:hypothetical protein
MNRIDEVQSTMMDWMNRQQKVARKAVDRFDWHDYVPTERQLRGWLPGVQPKPAIDTTSLVVGLVIGVGIGVGLGVIASRPSLNRAKRQVRQAIEAAEENLQKLPQRLNITRMEEESAQR